MIIIVCRGTNSDSYKMTRRKTKRHTVTEMWTIEYLLPYKTKLQHSVDQPWHGPGLKVVPVVIQVENLTECGMLGGVFGRNWPKCLEMGLTFTSQLWPQDMGESKPKVNQWKDPTVETDSSLFFLSTGMHWQHTISFLVGAPWTTPWRPWHPSAIE